jgi:hypothetical protein
MAITLDFLTGAIGWSSSTGSTAPVVDGVYLTEISDYFITESGDYLAIE